jgi:hypothetical protein
MTTEETAMAAMAAKINKQCEEDDGPARRQLAEDLAKRRAMEQATGIGEISERDAVAMEERGAW